MHFARTEEQNELAATVRALLGKRSDSSAVRAALASASGYDVALWQALCEQIGVAALAIPEEHDGFGAGLVESAVVLEELGENLAPTPLLGSALATAALLAYGTDEARTELLPALAAGAPACLERGRGSAASPVLDAPGAEIVLRAEGAELLLVESSTIEPVGSMDQTLRWGRITGGTGRVVGRGIDPDVLDALAGALISALQVGAAQRALRMTVGYTGERVQFGRPIGSFQALKHRMADMLVLVESARSASWGATASAAGFLAAPDEDARRALIGSAAVAGAYCTEALDRVAGEMIQLHGGIAITWEHDAHLVFKRAHALGQLGGAAHRRREVALANR